MNGSGRPEPKIWIRPEPGLERSNPVGTETGILDEEVRTALLPPLNMQGQWRLKFVLSEVFDGPNCYFSVTCDIWSSIALDSYLGLVIDFIDKQFNRKQVMLRCMPYNKSHIWSYIHDRVMFIFDSWNLPKRSLHMILSDTAANMKKAFKIEEWGRCFIASSTSLHCQLRGGAKYINVYPLHEKAKIYIYINIH